MHGDPHNFADLLLGQGHVEPVVRDPPNDLETLAKLDDDMGKSIQSRALAHIHDPLAKQGRIDQAVLPQNFGNVRPAGG